MRLPLAPPSLPCPWLPRLKSPPSQSTRTHAHTHRHTLTRFLFSLAPSTIHSTFYMFYLVVLYPHPTSTRLMKKGTSSGSRRAPAPPAAAPPAPRTGLGRWLPSRDTGRTNEETSRKPQISGAPLLLQWSAAEPRFVFFGSWPLNILDPERHHFRMKRHCLRIRETAFLMISDRVRLR